MNITTFRDVTPCNFVIWYKSYSPFCMLRQVYVGTNSKNKPHLRPEEGAAGFSENLVLINKASHLHNSENVAMFNVLQYFPVLISVHDFRSKINCL